MKYTKVLNWSKSHWPNLLTGILFLVYGIIILRFMPDTFYKDERFFIPLAQRFSQFPSLNIFDLIKTYPLPQPPLPYIVGGLAYKLIPSIYALRFLNSLFVLFSFHIIFSAIKDNPKENKLILCSLITLLVNPYFHMIATSFYTDGLYLFLITFGVSSLIKNKKSRYIAWVFIPLCRQMGLNYAFSEGVNLIFARQWSLVFKKGFLLALTTFPLIALFIFWGGASPFPEFNEKVARLRGEYGPLFFSNILYYLSSLGFWLSPLIILKGKKLWKYKIALVPLALLGIFLYPQFNLYHQEVKTLGLFHTLLYKLPMILNKGLYGVFTALGGIFCYNFLKDKSVLLYFKINLVIFFLLQSINPLCWDKYLLEVIWIIVISQFLNTDSNNVSDILKNSSKAY